MKYFNLLIFSGLLLMGVFVGKNAEAFCLEPKMNIVAPTTDSLLKPSYPRCLSGTRYTLKHSGYRYTRKHSCEEWEIQKYINEVDDYISDLNEFADEALSFTKAANMFAKNAVKYADCERDTLVIE